MGVAVPVIRERKAKTTVLRIINVKDLANPEKCYTFADQNKLYNHFLIESKSNMEKKSYRNVVMKKLNTMKIEDMRRFIEDTNRGDFGEGSYVRSVVEEVFGEWHKGAMVLFRGFMAEALLDMVAA